MRCINTHGILLLEYFLPFSHQANLHNKRLSIKDLSKHHNNFEPEQLLYSRYYASLSATLHVGPDPHLQLLYEPI